MTRPVRPTGSVDAAPFAGVVGILSVAVLSLVVLSAGVLSLGLSAAPVSAQPISAQPADGSTDPAVSIAVTSASPWVESGGAWQAAMRITGAPVDAKVTYSIRQPASGSEAKVRETLISSRAGDDEPKVMRSPVTRTVTELTDASGLTRLEIPVRPDSSGDRDRILIPNSGIYPVVVTVTTAGGDALQHVTLYLNRLPVPNATKAPADPFRLGVVVQHRRLGGFDDQGEPQIAAPLRSVIATTTEILAGAGDLPVSLDLSPESIVALTQSRTPGDLELVDRLRSELDSTSVMRVPWADLHVEGWATTGTLSEVQTSILDGQQALAARMQRPITTDVWPVDPTVGASGVQLLTKLGVTAMLVEPGQLAETKPPSGESGMTRPFQLKGAGGATLTGLAVDPELNELLATSVGTATLNAHQIVTQLLGAWLADTQSRGAVLQLDGSADPKVLAALFDALRTGDPSTRPITVVAPAEVAELTPIVVRQSGREVPWDRMLLGPASVPDVSGVASRLKTARPLVDDYAAIVPSGDDVAARLAIVIQRGLDQRLAPSAQETLLDTAIATMRDDLGKISASGPKSLTVTSRNTSVPLRLTNDLGRPIQVRLRLQSPQLQFTDGTEQTLTLEPGLNRLDVRVDVRASGQFIMQADLLSPRSDRVLASTRERIRSRAFSGVGLMLSGGALLFLVIWWSRTLRRRNNDTGEGADSEEDVHPSDDPVETLTHPV